MLLQNIMTTEELESKPKVEETTVPPAPAEEKKIDDSELESDQSKNVEESIEVEEQPEEAELDYKAELDKAKGSLKKAEHTIVRLKKKEKEEVPEIDEEDIADRIARKAQEKIRDDLSMFRQDDLNDYLNDEIAKTTSSLEEAELVRFIYDERFKHKPTSKKDILELVADAKLLANKKRYVQENRELKASLAAKSSISNTGYGQSVPKSKETQYEPTEKDRQIASKYFGGDMGRYLKNKDTHLQQT